MTKKQEDANAGGAIVAIGFIIFLLYWGCEDLTSLFSGGDGYEFEQCTCIFNTRDWTYIDRRILTEPGVSKSIYCLDTYSYDIGGRVYFNDGELEKLQQYRGHQVKFRAKLVSVNNGYGYESRIKNVKIMRDEGYGFGCNY